MGLSPQYYDECTDDVLNLYAELEDRIIADVVRRIVKTGDITETAKWQIRQAQQMGLLYDDIIKDVAQYTSKTDSEVKKMFENAGVETVNNDNRIHLLAGNSPLDIRQSESMLQILNAVYKERLTDLTEQTQQKEAEAAALDKKIEKTRQRKVDIESIDKIEARPVMLSPSRVSLEKSEYETLAAAAKKYYAQEKQEGKLKKLLKDAKKTIADLKAKIESLVTELSAVKAELAQYKSVRGQLRTADLEQENDRLRSRLRTYEDVISRNNLWPYFSRHREKTPTRDDFR